MTYQELKNIDLNLINNQDDADNIKNEILKSEELDIIKYINYLRWTQSNSESFKYISRIIKFLSYTELQEIEHKNLNIILGEEEDLVFLVEEEKKLIQNPIYIDGVAFSVKSILKDDFEYVMIVKSETESDSDNNLNIELAEKFIDELKLLFIPMDIDELNSYWTNINIQDGIDCVEALKNESDFGFKKTMIEMMIDKIRDDNTKIPINRNNIKTVQKYGFILEPKNYAYELYEEPIEYYEKIIESSVGTKVNVLCDILGENQMVKTFTKISSNIDNFNFELVKKTNLGIISTVTKEGTYNIIKKENVISNFFTKKEKNNPEKTGMVNVVGLGQMNQKDLLDSIKAASKSVGRIENNIKEYDKEDFRDNFKFDKKWYFSICDNNYSGLSHSTLILNGLIDEFIADENGEYQSHYDYVDQVYQLLYKYFGIVEELEGYWSIDNSILERVIRKLISSGAQCTIVKNVDSEFLRNFNQNKKLERMYNPVMDLQIVKIISTTKELTDFAKNSGTELYIQIGQNIISVLEGAQRVYGPNHLVFDSNNKLIICKYDKLDLYEASCYAIENNYDNFYDIQKDHYQTYDAWYKEKMILIDDEIDIEPTAIKIMKHCNKCNTDKEISDFYKDKRKIDGHRYTCKECEKISKK